MDPCTCATIATDINANVTSKSFDENSGIKSLPETTHELRELPFYNEDISNVFEINPNLSNKSRRRRFLWKRKRYFRKYKCIHRKRPKTSTVTVQEKIEDASMNIDKDYQGNLGNKGAGNQCMPLETDQIRDLNSKPTEELQQHEFQHDIQITGVEKSVQDHTIKGASPTNNDESCIDPQQSPLQSGENSAGDNDGKDVKSDMVKKDTDTFQAVEVTEETEHTVIPSFLAESGKKESREKTTEGVKDQTSKEAQQKGKKSPRPNYFVAIPVANEKILDLIEDVQEHIVLKEPKLLKALIPAERVHVTILVAHLKTPEEVQSAVLALQNSKEKVEQLLDGGTLDLNLHGIGQFNDQVIFIKVPGHEQELLCKIAEAVMQCFKEKGVDVTGSKEFNPHLTFLKLTKAPFLRRKGFRRICSDLYKEYEDHSFGTEMFSRIDLCSMHKKNKESGYYYCESSIIIEAIKPQEVKSSVSEPTAAEANEAHKTMKAATSCSSASSLEKDADKITADISNATDTSKEESIKKTNVLPEAASSLLEEKFCLQSTPEQFPAEPIAATDEGPEK